MRSRQRAEAGPDDQESLTGAGEARRKHQRFSMEAGIGARSLAEQRIEVAGEKLGDLRQQGLTLCGEHESAMQPLEERHAERRFQQLAC